MQIILPVGRSHIIKSPYTSHRSIPKNVHLRMNLPWENQFQALLKYMLDVSFPAHAACSSVLASSKECICVRARLWITIRHRGKKECSCGINYHKYQRGEFQKSVLQIVGKELISFSDFFWQLYILEHKLFNVSCNKWWWCLGSYDFVHFSMVSQRS